jgi:hypothetical protein
VSVRNGEGAATMNIGDTSGLSRCLFLIVALARAISCRSNLFSQQTV